jgi:hypothetical protein
VSASPRAPLTEQQARKKVRQELQMIRSSRDAGVDEEVREYERNLADAFAALHVRLAAQQAVIDALKGALRREIIFGCDFTGTRAEEYADERLAALAVVSPEEPK